MKRGRKTYLLYAGGAISAGAIIYFVIQLILAGYPISWTGFGDYANSSGETVRGKTLWDWLDLLIVPLVLALGAFALNRSEKKLEREGIEERAKLEREIANEHQQDTVLQTYFDRMSELLLKDKLRTTKKAEVRDIARTRTLSIMRVLDTRRNNLVIQFLREAKLITEKNSIFIKATMGGMNLQRLRLNYVNLESANLEGANLEGANLEGANLQGANLQGANLQGAYLWEANLQGAYLKGADLQETILAEANLQDASLNYAILGGAILGGANLQGADLWEANLQGANLQGANLGGARNATEGQLAKAKYLKGTTMPDGTIHE